MNVDTAFVVNAAELVQPTIGPFDRPMMNSPGTAMSRTAFIQRCRMPR